MLTSWAQCDKTLQEKVTFMDTKEMAYYSNPGGTLEKFLLNNLKPLISRNEELYISNEANKENALASEGKSCRPQKNRMHVTTSQYDIHVYSISGQNSHLLLKSKCFPPRHIKLLEREINSLEQATFLHDR